MRKKGPMTVAMRQAKWRLKKDTVQAKLEADHQQLLLDYADLRRRYMDSENECKVKEFLKITHSDAKLPFILFSF